MFIPSSNYLNEIELLVESSKSLDVAVAFWGEGSDKIFTRITDQPVRIICNLTMGGTNPKPIQQLLKQKNIVVHQLNNLHAKVLIGTNAAILGSANLSTNGLNQEPDECGGWEEAGVRIADKKMLREMEDWFQLLWAGSAPIKEADINKARQMWERRRSNRPSTSSNLSTLLNDASFFKDRPVFLVIYTEDASEQAEKTYEKAKKSYEKLTPGDEPVLNLSYFEDDLPYSKESSLIGVYMGARGSVKVDSKCLRPIPELDRSFVNRDGGKSWIRMVAIEKNIFGMKFDRDACQLILKKIKSHKKEIDKMAVFF